VGLQHSRRSFYFADFLFVLRYCNDQSPCLLLTTRADAIARLQFTATSCTYIDLQPTGSRCHTSQPKSSTMCDQLSKNDSIAKLRLTLQQVVQCCDQNTLLTLRQVNQTCCDFATPLAFACFRNPSSASWYEEIQGDEEFLKFVKEFKWESRIIKKNGRIPSTESFK
jgi:hypothetical protein